MLDFHGLFPSYVALFPGGVYMEIESLRLDLHLKRKQKKPQGQHRRRNKKKKKLREKGKKKNPEKKVFEEERKEKKKNPDARPGFAAQRTGSRRDLVARCDLGRGRATQVVAARDATWV